jgi:hypothetical protein
MLYNSRAVSVIALLVGGSSFFGCDADKALECGDVCSKVEECGADAPAPQIEGILEGEGSGSAGVDCAANCVQENAAFYGYADCQIDCILAEDCGAVNDCWDATSAVFEKHCLAGRETTPVAPDESTAGEIENGTTTGSAEADDAVSNPAVESGVEGSGFVVNYGDTPPSVNGLFGVEGSIDESSNARAPGSRIATNLCFHNQVDNGNGWTTDYCEYGVPGIVSAPITGEGNNFTMYFEYPGQATILFSGTTDDAGNVADAEALVVYTYTIDAWEHSFTDWTLDGACDGSECTP